MKVFDKMSLVMEDIRLVMEEIRLIIGEIRLDMEVMRLVMVDNMEVIVDLLGCLHGCMVIMEAVGELIISKVITDEALGKEMDKSM